MMKKGVAYVFGHLLSFYGFRYRSGHSGVRNCAVTKLQIENLVRAKSNVIIDGKEKSFQFFCLFFRQFVTFNLDTV